MGQTSELDEEKSSVLVLPDAIAKDADDISKGFYVGNAQSRLQWSKPAPAAGLPFLKTTV